MLFSILRASVTESRAVSVEWMLLKPDCLLSRRLFCARNEESWLNTTCLSVFAMNGRKVCSFLKLLDLERFFFLQWAYPSLLKCWGKCTSVKRSVDNVSKCMYDWRRNSLKEVSGDRIKWTSSRMIGKDKFENFHLRERREGGERVCICHY